MKEALIDTAIIAVFIGFTASEVGHENLSGLPLIVALVAGSADLAARD